MKLLQRLRRLFSSKRNVIQTRSGTARLEGRSLHPHWIVGRDLCMYRREDFANVPRGKRRSALALKLPVWSPFERTGHYCVWSGSTAMVWFWDEDKVGAGAGSDGLGASSGASDAPGVPGPSQPGAPGPPQPGAPGPPQSGTGARLATGLRVLPEAVFHARKPDGLHLQRCREGVELQYWRSGVLVDAFWFPDRPDRDSLRSFIDRQAGGAQALQSSNPAVAGGELSPEPWRVPLAPGEWLEANERPLVAACLLVLALAVAWQEARFWKIHHLRSSAAAELARMQDELDPLLAARNELVTLHRTNRALSAILGEPSQARLMGLVDRAIPNAQARFREWSYQQRELQVVVEDPDPDPITYVRSLEAEPLFDQVRAEPVRGDDQLRITLRVRV